MQNNICPDSMEQYILISSLKHKHETHTHENDW